MGNVPEITRDRINKDGTEMAEMFDRVHGGIKGISKVCKMLLSSL